MWISHKYILNIYHKKRLSKYHLRINLIAGVGGMAGSTFKICCLNVGYGININDEINFSPSRKELDFIDSTKVSNWFKANKLTNVILAAAKVGVIYSKNQTR